MTAEQMGKKARFWNRFWAVCAALAVAVAVGLVFLFHESQIVEF